MPLNALPVTPGELEELQAGTTFTTNTGQATSQAALINLDNGVDTVASYAVALLNANIATSQVAMATTCLMWGATQEIDFLTNTATVAAPQFVALAAQIGTNAVTTSAEGVGVALADDPQFQPFLDLNAVEFAAAVGVATGVNVSQIGIWVAFWTKFATDNPSVLQPGVTVQEFAYGASFGDAIGVALQNPTTADLQTTVETNAQGELIIGGEIANALLTIATGQYQVGIDCALLPQHDPLQGEAGSVPVTELTLTIGLDTPDQGFTTGNGGQFDIAGGVFNAPAGGNPPLGTTNTLNTGDELVSTVGDAILNFTAVNNFAANPSFAEGVAMTGVNEANILNLSDDLAGFSGNITGLTIATVQGGSRPQGDVQVGQDGLGLNTALATVNINAGDFDITNNHDHNNPPNNPNIVNGASFTAWIESAAFAGGEALDLNLNGVGTFVDLNVTGGGNFYEAVNVHSLVGANHVELNTNADTIATVNADGDQDLRACGTALNQDTLTTFDASTATGDVTAIFEGPNDGGVDVIGGDGNDNFWFLTTDQDFVNQLATGETSFTTDDTVDGGGGDNTLTLQAFEGALLGAGVGANITNITTIVHSTDFDPCFFFGDNCFFNPMQNDLTVDMSESGSATVLDLAGWYNTFDVDVTNLANTDTVIYSGEDLGVLTLDNPSATGIYNLTMAQDACVSEDLGGGGPVDHFIDTLVVPTGLVLNLDSIGEADLNVVNVTDQVDIDVVITGDVDLDFAPAENANADAYDFDGGVIDASAFTGDLNVSVGDGSQTVIGGSGDDYIETFSANAPDLIDLGVGGADTVEFESTFSGNDAPVTNVNYTLVTGFDFADDVVNLDVVGSDLDNIANTFTGNILAPGDVAIPLVYTTDTDFDADQPPGFNFIKVDTPINLLDTQDAQDGFEAAMGPNGDINVTGGNLDFLFAYFDATHQQMVLGIVDNAAGNIDDNDDFDVISLIAMNKADYDNFSADNLGFVDI